MKTYTFKLVIREGNDEFWEGLKGTGCDEVHEAIKACLQGQGWLVEDDELTLTKFEDEKE